MDKMSYAAHGHRIAPVEPRPSVRASENSGSEHRKQMLFSSAKTAFDEGRMTEAYRGFIQALRLDPEDAQILYMLSETCIRLGAIEQATMYSSSTLAVDPTFKAALAVQIEVSVRQNDLDHARALLRQHPAGGSYAPMHALLEQRLASAEENFEVTLTELASLVERNEKLILARELFEESFKRFLNSGQNDRYHDFIDALGLHFEASNSTEGRSLWFEPAPSSIDIVIPVHNAVRELADCLASLRRWHDPALKRIILVDDASDRVTKAWLDRYVARNPETILVRHSENLGFTRSAIAGIAQSDAPFFILLNSDTIVSAGWMAGLWRGLAANASHAMAGPLSNCAYFQSIAHLQGKNEIVGTEQVRIIDKRAAFVRANGLAAYPKVPFLSGFCLMVRREHYEAAVGLDAKSYPRGYWEVQDLALRMIDLGLYPCLVDDVYVHHSQSGSIEAERRDALVSDGFRQICARHGVIRVLAAEEVCRHLPDVRRQSQAEAAFFQVLKPSQKLPETARVLPAHRWIVSPPAGLISPSAEVCLFVAHAPYGQLAEFTSHYLQELRRSGLRVVVCLAVDNLDSPIQSDWLNHAVAVLLRENAGFDFGAWSDLLKLVPELWEARRLLFANDSVVGPFQPLFDVFDRIRKKDAGFFALTDCTLFQYHAQSYFFGWAGQNLSAPELRAFWDSVKNFSDKEEAIQHYEIPLLSLCDVLPDQSRQILFGIHDVFGPYAEMLPPFSAAHHAWQALIRSGNPFIKTEVLRSGVASFDEVAALTGADKAMLQRHVEQSNLNRM